MSEESLAGGDMASMGELIERTGPEILTRWSEAAHKAASARGLDQPELRNVLPLYLRGLASGADVGELVEVHVADRVRRGFELAEIVEEFVLLEQCINATWLSSAAAERPSEEERSALTERIQRSVVLVTNLFKEHMDLDEQREKRYGQLLQVIADKALRSPDAPLRSDLRDVLGLLLEATAADSISLVLFDPESGKMLTGASAGDAADEFERSPSARTPRASSARSRPATAPRRSRTWRPRTWK